MKFYIYNTDETGLEEWKVRNQGKSSYAAVDLTATYDRQALSRKAPMLVSGSAVTLIFRTVMGGPLGGRFGFQYLKPLSIDEGATLITKLINIYFRGNSISPENAIYASAQVTGHPYYLYCLVTSDFPEKTFASKENIDQIIDYEIKKGKIYGFWQTHFEENKEYINNDNDQEIAKKIIYYFVRYNNQEVDIAEIAETIKIDKKEVEKKIENLYLADLVYKTEGRYYAFNDICLMRYIKFVYEKKGIDDINTSERGKFNYLKGKFLELVVRQSMSRFNGEEIDAKYFGKKDKMNVSLFSVVDTRYAKGEKTDNFQIDVFAKEANNNRAWLVECKYQKGKMGIGTFKKAEKASIAYKEQHKQETNKAVKVQIYLVSTGGFTQELLNEIKEREDIYFSDYEGINYIFRKFGGGFNIPLFNS